VKMVKWLRPVLAIVVTATAMDVAFAAGDEEGAGKATSKGGAEKRMVQREAHEEQMAQLGLTEDQQAELAAARKAALDATKDIKDPKERGKAIRALMAEAHDRILTEEQKAKLEEIREDHKGRGKGNPGPGGQGRGKGAPGPGGAGHGKGSPGPGGAGHGKGAPGPGRHAGE